jgi:Rad3-related DNA helicase
MLFTTRKNTLHSVQKLPHCRTFNLKKVPLLHSRLEFERMMNPEELLASAIEQVQVAANQLKQQHSMESKMWQRKAHELQSVVESLQAQLRDAQNENAQLHLAVDERTKEADHLRTMNDSLTQSLQEQEQIVARYVSLNQSLKSLLEDQPDVATRPQHEAAFVTSRSQIQRAPPSPPESKPTQGSVFIRAAKSELTYSDFNQMISEINLYNKHQQSREETITNVKKLLCPAHSTLFDQFLPMIAGN